MVERLKVKVRVKVGVNDYCDYVIVPMCPTMSESSGS